MLKKILLGAVLAFICTNTDAQISLNQANMPLTPKSVKIQLLNENTLPVFMEGANQTWKLDSVMVVTTDSIRFVANTNPAFPSTALQEHDMWEEIVADRGFFFSGYHESNAGALMTTGFSADRQAYAIGDLTGNSNDTFLIPTQTVLLNGTKLNVAYPASFTDMWGSAYSRSFDFELTLTAMGLNKTPGNKLSHFMQYDSVSGWGKMRFPVAGGNSQYFDVLMVQRVEVRIDSIFLDGSPAPEMLMDAFGLKQGDTTLQFRTLFYRANDFYPLMVVNYGEDATMTNPVNAYINTNGAVLTGVNETNSAITSLSVFPNPLTDQKLQVNFRKEGIAPWNLTIVNTLGQVVHAERINQSSGDVNLQLELNNNIHNGLYIMQLTDEKGIIKATNKITVAK